MERPSETSRRRYLALLSTGAAASLAGCSFIGGGGSSSASLKGPKFVGPKNPTVQGEVEPVIELQNTGEVDTTFEETFYIEDEDISYEEQVSFDVPAGKTVKKKLPPVSFTYADTYTFTTASESRGSFKFTVKPVLGKKGESVKISPSLRMTVTDVLFRDTIFTTVPSQEGVASAFNAPSTKILAIFKTRVENVSTSRATVPSPEFFVQNGGIFRSTPVPASEGPFTGPDIASGVQLKPSETANGYILGQISREAAKSKAVLGMQNIPDSTFGGGDPFETTPEYTWEFPANGSRSFPNYRLKTVKAPRTATKGERFDVTAVVRNTGSAGGKFRGVLQHKTPQTKAATDIQGFVRASNATPTPVTKHIQKGKEAFITLRITPQETGELTYRLAPFSKEWKVNVQQ